MKYLLKGLALGVSLNIAARVCGLFIDDDVTFLISALIFYAIITLFLVSESINHMLLTGFGGLFFMVFCEVVVFGKIDAMNSITGYYIFMAYLSGLQASTFSVITATILTRKKVKLSTLIKRGEVVVNKKTEIKLLAYMDITAVLFPYLVLPENAGISVPVFAIIQFACLWFIVQNKKSLILYIPIFIMAINRFISANSIWLVSNCILSVILYCSMFMEFDIKTDSFGFVTGIINYIAAPFSYFDVPFRCMSKMSEEKAPVIKRIVIALAIAIPCCIGLVAVLANADMVFNEKSYSFFSKISGFISINTVGKIIIGIVVSLFLFGAVYNSYKEETEEKVGFPKFKGDLLVINIVLAAILVVYTLFVIIQFKYLFAGKVLPAGFTYTEYARKGFFELLALTGVNVAVILAVIKLTKQHSGRWLKFTGILCHYLCAVTIVLLVSSYFRMKLYIADDGLTRLRLFVIGFLIFEAVGLLITFLYIAKPRFNLALVYIAIALVYYMVLNVMPADYIIAKNQINNYLDGKRNDIEYVFTLSADAAPALSELKDKTKDGDLLNRIDIFLKYHTASEIPERWQRFNLSVENAKNLCAD